LICPKPFEHSLQQGFLTFLGFQIMKNIVTSIIAGGLVILAAGTASAQDAGSQQKTRSQVQAELVQAQQTGDISEPWTGKKLNELYPARYTSAKTNADNAAVTPALADTQQAGKTRQQVMAELAQAQRTGEITEPWTGTKLNELYPNRYSKVDPVMANAPATAKQGS
jgi:hypothetical protein